MDWIQEKSVHHASILISAYKIWKHHCSSADASLNPRNDQRMSLWFSSTTWSPAVTSCHFNLGTLLEHLPHKEDSLNILQRPPPPLFFSEQFLMNKEGAFFLFQGILNRACHTEKRNALSHKQNLYLHEVINYNPEVNFWGQENKRMQERWWRDTCMLHAWMKTRILRSPQRQNKHYKTRVNRIKLISFYRNLVWS